jgi:predicted Zn-dependent protease
MTTASLNRPRRDVNLPVAFDQVVDLELAAIVDELGDARHARCWLTAVLKNTPDALVPHIQLSQTVVLLERAVPGSAMPGVMDVESAIARDDWQTAYDLCISNTQPSSRALASLMLVVDALNAAEQYDAVLELLSRAVDLYEGTTAVYWALVQVLVKQGRLEDAEAALLLLRGYTS